MPMLGKLSAVIMLFIGMTVFGTGCATAPSPAVVMPAHTAAKLSFECNPRASMQLINESENSVYVTLHKAGATKPARSLLSPGMTVDVPVPDVTAIEFENRSYDEAVVICESRNVANLQIDPIVAVITTPYYAGVTE